MVGGSGNGVDQNVKVADSGLLRYGEGFGGTATVEASAQAQVRVHPSSKKSGDVVERGYGGQGMTRGSDAYPSTLGSVTTHVSSAGGGGCDARVIFSPTRVISAVSSTGIGGGGCGGQRQCVISTSDHEIEAEGGGKKENCSGDVESGAYSTSSGECKFHEHARWLKKKNPVDSFNDSTPGDVDGVIDSCQPSVGSLDVASKHRDIEYSEVYDQRCEEEGKEEEESNTEDDDDDDEDDYVDFGSPGNPILVGLLSSQDYLEIVKMCRPLEESNTEDDDDDGGDDEDDYVDFGSPGNPILVGLLSPQDYLEIVKMCRPLEESNTEDDDDDGGDDEDDYVDFGSPGNPMLVGLLSPQDYLEIVEMCRPLEEINP